MPPRGVALLVGTILGWGLAWPMIKIGVSELSPWTYRGLMLPAAGIVMFVVAVLGGERFTLPRGQWRVLLASSFLNITCWTLFSTWGLSFMGSGHASIIAYTMPLWAVALAILFVGERPTLRRISGLVVGLAGLGVLMSSELGVIAESPIGTLLMLISALAWGSGTVVHKSVVWRTTPMMLTGWMIFVGGLPITAVALTLETPDLTGLSTRAIGATVFVLFISTVFCWYAWFRAVTLLPIVVSTVAVMMVPVVAVLSGGLILGEHIGVLEIAALALVVAAIALVLIPARPRPAPEPEV